MTIRNLILSGALAVASLTVVSAKSYDIVLSNPTQVANVQLKAGEYTLKVEGSNAVFTNVETGKKFTAPAKVENADKKFDLTAVGTDRKNDTDYVQSIELGGTSTRLEFNQGE